MRHEALKLKAPRNPRPQPWNQDIHVEGPLTYEPPAFTELRHSLMVAEFTLVLRF
jgi:hypothetical protein